MLRFEIPTRYVPCGAYYPTLPHFATFSGSISATGHHFVTFDGASPLLDDTRKITGSTMHYAYGSTTCCMPLKKLHGIWNGVGRSGALGGTRERAFAARRFFRDMDASSTRVHTTPTTARRLSARMPRRPCATRRAGSKRKPSTAGTRLARRAEGRKTRDPSDSRPTSKARAARKRARASRGYDRARRFEDAV